MTLAIKSSPETHVGIIRITLALCFSYRFSHHTSHVNIGCQTSIGIEMTHISHIIDICCKPTYTCSIGNIEIAISIDRQEVVVSCSTNAAKTALKVMLLLLASLTGIIGETSIALHLTITTYLCSTVNNAVALEGPRKIIHTKRLIEAHLSALVTIQQIADFSTLQLFGSHLNGTFALILTNGFLCIKAIHPGTILRFAAESSIVIIR